MEQIACRSGKMVPIRTQLSNRLGCTRICSTAWRFGGTMLLSKVTFKVIGKEVHPSQLGSKLKEAAVGAVKDSLLAKIEAVHCTVHDQNAKAVLKATTEGKLNYEIQGCCNELIEEVKRLIGA